MSKEKENSVDAKSGLRTGSDSMKVEKLSERMQEILDEYVLSIHGVSEDSKANYVGQVKTFGRFLTFITCETIFLCP